MSVFDELALGGDLVALAAASSLTDELARRALAQIGGRTQVLDVVRSLGFTVTVGPEWRLDTELRRELVAAHSGSDESWQRAHHFYLDESRTLSLLDSLPFYLVTGPGRAYHGTELEPENGPEYYRDLAHIDALEISVEALRLASDQSDRGLLDLQGPTFLFLRGMTLYRMGRRVEALELLRRVVRLDDGSRDVAVAQHLVGYWDCSHGNKGGVEAEQLLRASHKNAVTRSDLDHLAHVKHSMALCMLKRHPRKRQQAVKLLRESLEITEQIGDEWGRAKVLHSLGQALGTETRTRSEARVALEGSLEIGRRLHYRRHQSAVLNSLARIATTDIARDRLLAQAAVVFPPGTRGA